jgi:hypothetical protein
VYDSKMFIVNSLFSNTCCSAGICRWFWGPRYKLDEKASPERGFLFFYPKFRIPSLEFNRANFVRVGRGVSGLESGFITLVRRVGA